MRVALTIGGSDSGGGAGIQADLKTFHRFGVFGTSAITVVTSQNTLGVSGWVALDAAFVRSQIDAVATDLRPAATKSGLLRTAPIVTAVATAVRDHRLAPFVLDPVMAAASGEPVVEESAVAAVRDELAPLATVITPNLDEVTMLLGKRPRDSDAMCRAAEALVGKLGAHAALVKGGHLDGDDVVDVLYDGDHHVFRRGRIVTMSTHGAGCTLSAAITAGLAADASLHDAVAAALAYVHRAVATAPGLGAGHGPLNHWA